MRSPPLDGAKLERFEAKMLGVAQKVIIQPT